MTCIYIDIILAWSRVGLYVLHAPSRKVLTQRCIASYNIKIRIIFCYSVVSVVALTRQKNVKALKLHLKRKHEDYNVEGNATLELDYDRHSHNDGRDEAEADVDAADVMNAAPRNGDILASHFALSLDTEMKLSQKSTTSIFRNYTNSNWIKYFLVPAAGTWRAHWWRIPTWVFGQYTSSKLFWWTFHAIKANYAICCELGFT